MIVVKGSAGTGKSRRMRELYVKDVNNGKKVLLIDYELRGDTVRDLEELIPFENRKNIVFNVRRYDGMEKEELEKRVKHIGCNTLYLDCGMQEEDLGWLKQLSETLGVKVVVSIQDKDDKEDKNLKEFKV